MPPVEFRVLGPLEVRAGGQPLGVGGARQRTVLALLVAAAGRVVSVPALVDGLWGQRPPPDAARTARAYVSRLRRVLPDDGVGGRLVTTRAPGYLLAAAADSVDAARFERLAAAGQQEQRHGHPAAAGERLAAALALWHGRPYAEFDQVPALHGESRRLQQVWLTAVQDRIDADLGSGLGAGLVAELEALTVRYPAHERLWGQLMVALYRAGRQAEALTAFTRARAELVEAAGVEPSADLNEIHRQVLAQDPRLLGGRPAGPVVGPLVGPGRRTAVPAQLPPVTGTFAGRRGDLAALDDLVETGPRPGAVVIGVLSGTAGVGKTTLAVHWAHRVARRYPDGQLFADLRGFDGCAQPVEPAAAIRQFLEGLGLPARDIPTGLDAQVAQYRTLLAGRRVLVVLDNARSVAQVRPLLPGAPGCLVLVTSRNRLSGLVAVEGARPFCLDVPTEADARELLATRLAAARLRTDPEAVDRIVAGCARLPLALAIVAARAATHPGVPLRALARELHSGDRLQALSAYPDPHSDLRSVLSWSYRAVSGDAARLFRLLGLLPWPDFSVAAAAGLAGLPAAQVRPLLSQLAGAGLLVEHADGRYSCHDLLRAYAADLSHGADTAADRAAAAARMLDHYLGGGSPQTGEPPGQA